MRGTTPKTRAAKTFAPKTFAPKTFAPKTWAAIAAISLLIGGYVALQARADGIRYASEFRTADYALCVQATKLSTGTCKQRAERGYELMAHPDVSESLVAGGLVAGAAWLAFAAALLVVAPLRRGLAKMVSRHPRPYFLRPLT